MNENTRKSIPTPQLPALRRPGTENLKTLPYQMKTEMPKLTRRSETSRVVNVVFVVDTSPSMKGEKLNDATRGVQLAERELAAVDPEKFAVSIVSFSHQASIVEGMRSVRAQPALPNLAIGDCTAIGEGINLGNQVATEKTNADVAAGRNPKNIMLVLTDGQNQSGRNPIKEAAAAKASGTLVLTIAYGDDADMTQLRAIASSPAHALKAGDADALKKIFRSFARTVSQTAVGGGDFFQRLATI
jgi:uncharacterized protein YegL